MGLLLRYWPDGLGEGVADGTGKVLRRVFGGTMRGFPNHIDR